MRTSYAHMLDLLASGKLVVEPLISHRFAKDELPECYRRLDEGAKDIVGAVFHW